MAYEQKEGQGIMFPNDKKGNEKAPDLKGTVFINGVLTEIALWKKQGQKGEFYSVSQKTKSELPDTSKQPF